MGIETAIIVATIAKIGIDYQNAKAQAEAVEEQGALEAQRLKLESFAKGARQKASFAASGITLQGTPMSVLESTYGTAEQDIGLISRNVETQQRNIMGSFQRGAIKDIVGTAITLGGASAMQAGAGAGSGVGSGSLTQSINVGGEAISFSTPQVTSSITPMV